MKRTLFEKLGDFVLGKGFYIVLFLCVATIGISGYYLFHSPAGGDTQQPVAGNPTVTLPDESAQPQAEAPAPAKTPAATGKATSPKTPAPQKPEGEGEAAQTPASPLQQAPAVYTWPVKGELLRGFSLEVLAYDETMGDWRTHCGVDIAAEEGIKVLAISDGTVREVYEDDLMGATVVVDHGEGLSSSYSNLDPNALVQVGQEVETGTVIGTVGHSAIAEDQLNAHLHLEMSQDGTAVDPVNYLPK